VRLDELGQRVERRLYRDCPRPALDVRIDDLVDLAEAAHERAGIALAPNAKKKFLWPENESSIPVIPEATIVAAAAPLRAACRRR
jgi:hypothetical protein